MWLLSQGKLCSSSTRKPPRRNHKVKVDEYTCRESERLQGETKAPSWESQRFRVVISRRTRARATCHITPHPKKKTRILHYRDHSFAGSGKVFAGFSL
ncbi:hypothetical protein DMENIID0001_004070 [Sergentomyia squamirostris]